jgi:hypothetical protein
MFSLAEYDLPSSLLDHVKPGAPALAEGSGQCKHEDLQPSTPGCTRVLPVQAVVAPGPQKLVNHVRFRPQEFATFVTQSQGKLVNR